MSRQSEKEKKRKRKEKEKKRLRGPETSSTISKSMWQKSEMSCAPPREGCRQELERHVLFCKSGVQQRQGARCGG